MSFTPEFADVLKQAINDRLLDVHTSLPAKVISYDPAKQRISAKVTLKRKYDDGTISDLPMIEDIPVYFPKGKSFSLTHPVAEGDYCQLIFNERSIEIFKRDGGTVDPRDARKFHLSDCYAIIGVQPETTVIAGAAADKFRILNGTCIFELQEGGICDIKNSSGEIKISANGEVLLTNSGGTIKLTSDGKFVINGANNLLTIIDGIITELLAAQVLTALGPQPFLPPTIGNLTTLKSQLAAITG